ncbi:MAG: PIN domain-containing protein [Spirochaetaceae bacterium]|jgi:predicted nucleic acid-binding protein|nr:PIN domain-containing protein [Spirochaetaceae bacterium]
MTTYALDTNTVSYFLKNNYAVQNKINEETDKGNGFVIPPTVYFEIMNWLLKNNSKKRMEIFERMYSEKGIGVIDKAVLDIASTARLKLQRQGRNISDDDLFIAAYCLRHDLPLVTNNTRHFMNIENLEILNWTV